MTPPAIQLQKLQKWGFVFVLFCFQGKRMYSRKPEVVEKEEGRTAETTFYSFVAFSRLFFVPHFYLTFLIIHRCTVVDVNPEFPEENDDAREVS